MFRLLSSRSKLPREASPSVTAAQRLNSTTRSPLAGAARKLKDVLTRTRPNNNVNLDPIASAKNPSTPPPTTTITSTEVSEPPLRRPVLESSTRSKIAAVHSTPPAGIVSSDSSNLDHDVHPATASNNSNATYSATPQDVQEFNQIPMEISWRQFTGEVGSWCSTDSSLLTLERPGPSDAQRRARAHRYSYLKHVGWLAPEHVANRDLARRNRARRNAYLTLDGAVSTEKVEKMDLERQARGRTYYYLKAGTLTPDLLVMRDLHRRECIRVDTYLKLVGELR
ncbi:hypothetical protein FRC00_000108 [Tulasnella sp. 408]|nr:hypothetical protein FRC00_000108 [Tulasnella sp. 408]